MTVRQINTALWIGCGAASVAAAAALVAGLTIPLDRMSNQQSNGTAKAVNTQAATQPLVDTTPLFNRTFRGSTSAATAATIEAAPTTQPAALTQIKLVGTVGTSLAILQGPDGSEALAEVGDDVEGAAITAIRSTEIDLRESAGTTVTLRLPTSSDSPLIH